MFNGWCHCVFRIQQSLNRQRTAEKERLFLVYAKQWWREFLEIRPSHQSKMVKIFAQVRLNPHVFLNLGSGLHLCTDIKRGSSQNVLHLLLESSWFVFSYKLSHYLWMCLFALRRMKTASTGQCVPMCVSSGQAGCWRALDRRPASSACWPTRRPRWWEAGEASRSSGAHYWLSCAEGR